MKKYLVYGFLVIYCLVLYQIKSYKPTVEPYHSLYDSRIHALVKFCATHKFANCPAKDYINAADTNKISFAILPAIDLLESSGGRFYPTDTSNRWGYGSSTGLRRFTSVQQGIAYVSNQLANGSPYRNKTLEQKIKTYNSANPNYYRNFLKLYNELNSDVEAK